MNPRGKSVSTRPWNPRYAAAYDETLGLTRGRP